MTRVYDPENPPLTDAQQETLDRIKDAEQAMLQFAEDWKYPQTLPRGPQGERAVLMLDYLLPDLQHILATHFISRGWRRHDDLAIIKPRKVVGGLFEDLVAYVPMDQPDDPIIAQAEQDPTPDPDPAMWSVKPVLTETYEERPADE